MYKRSLVQDLGPGNRGLEFSHDSGALSGMKCQFLICMGLAVLGSNLAMAQEKGKRPIFYPFDVTVGGQVAEMQQGNMLFAAVEKPVKSSAVVALEKESPLFVVNAFPCEEDGTVKENQPAAVIFKNKAKEVKLNETIDKKTLKPGTYLMNVVAHNTTSRVVFTVSEKKGDVKLPDLKKIVNFLRKKNQ